ncbi:hypothetical protein GCM10023321_85220 [Pseudonocardia eucalypti]|uniref:LysR family transcriptional regulator n=1 Tax=Pseudonocardia eucalypti TaxID=648755 RepID=A0ABP9RFS8_9PSEU|nr:DNA-binding transcriptional LysR family regulator [Pseudonocardia eucalypti]
MAQPRIETQDLTVFLAVADEGSFGAAAVRLQLAQPSVSTRMAALERKLGVRLFQRGPRGSSLTTAGERFAHYAKRCVHLLAETEAAVRADELERLVVAAPASLGTAIFPTVLEVLAGAPIDVVCRIAHSDEAVAAVLDGSAHAAFVLRRVLPPGVEARLVTSSAVAAVAAPDHPATALRRPQPGDLLDTAVVVHNWSEDARQVSALFTDPRRNADHPVRLVGTPDIAVDLAQHAGYVALVPRYASARAVRAGTLVPLALPPLGVELDIRLVCPAGPARRPGVERLLAATAELAGRIDSA